MKLLISPSHTWCAFQQDTFSLLSIQPDDFVCIEEGVVYSSVIIPPSLTHGGHSNEPPSSSARKFWNLIGELGRKQESNTIFPKKFYVSRRSWIHGDTSNMGTNYTTRRRCMNEDEIVAMLAKYGYEEVFCEKLSMQDKIQLFAQATHIVGCIGGGMANLLFSSPSTKSFCIETPDFLRINARFIHSMNHTDIQFLSIAHHAPFEGPFPLFTRVCVKETGQIGEAEEFAEGQYTVTLSQNNIAGFALGAELPRAYFLPFELEPLDGGLNSPYVIDEKALEQSIQQV
jgi:capsular polysaccharide biosynthesis protein